MLADFNDHVFIYLPPAELPDGEAIGEKVCNLALSLKMVQLECLCSVSSQHLKSSLNQDLC